jgi:tellurite resistance-related uncharacterized protein
MADSQSETLLAPAAELPVGLESYRRTDTFCERSVPAGLLKAHATKQGIWGLIRVTDGELHYRIEDERRIPAERRLRPGLPPGVVEPTILHSVEPAGPVHFYVEFFRVAALPR